MESITLTKENIEEWKQNLDMKMNNMFGIVNYSRCTSDKEWLENMLGFTIGEAIDIEVDSWIEAID